MWTLWSSGNLEDSTGLPEFRRCGVLLADCTSVSGTRSCHLKCNRETISQQTFGFVFDFLALGKSLFAISRAAAAESGREV